MARLLPPLLTEKVKPLVPAIACCAVATLFLVDLVGADADGKASDADPVEVVQPDNWEPRLSAFGAVSEAYESAVSAMIDAAAGTPGSSHPPRPCYSGLSPDYDIVHTNRRILGLDLEMVSSDTQHYTMDPNFCVWSSHAHVCCAP